jgi:phosphate-selective porin OprO/OprP|tara:strand:- start:8053 stop:9474 length:1422 start_codon:yes stop_codon:yes gene_type:complete
MISRISLSALLATTMIAMPASAQSRADAALARIEAMQAEIDALRAEVEQLRAESAADKGAATAAQAAPAGEAQLAETQPSAIDDQGARLQTVRAAAEKDVDRIIWKGAPVISGDGWSFKPRGRLQVNVGHVGVPDAAYSGSGWNSDIRRARLGFEGVIMYDFGYKLEVDFAGNEVEMADAFLFWEGSGLQIAVGNTKTGISLEEEASTRFTSFLERAAFTDAYDIERRVGVRFDYSAGDLLLTGTVQSDDVDALRDGGDDQWSVAGRIAYAPRLGEAGRLHVGASALHTNFASDAQNVRYRQRANMDSAPVRLVDTGTFAAKGDTIFGLEAAGIFGPLHVTGEASWAHARGAGQANGFGGYAEAGYFLTGETRGYKDWVWDRTKVLSPVTAGGMGALQLLGRLDYIDLDDQDLRGGTQTSYEAGLIWMPIDYVRLLLNYSHLQVEGGPFGALVDPIDGEYGADVFAMRAEIDF